MLRSRFIKASDVTKIELRVVISSGNKVKELHIIDDGSGINKNDVVQEIVEVYDTLAENYEMKVITKVKKELRAIKVSLEPQTIKDKRLKVSKLE